MGYTENDIKTLFAAFNLLNERVEHLEAEIRKLRGEKECVIIEMKPRKTS